MDTGAIKSSEMIEREIYMLLDVVNEKRKELDRVREIEKEAHTAKNNKGIAPP